MKKAGLTIGFIILVLAICAASAFLSGLIIWLLWNWVITSIFTSVAPISYWLAVGVGLCLSVIANFFKGIITVKKD